jgi:hypothetical protein
MVANQLCFPSWIPFVKPQGVVVENGDRHCSVHLSNDKLSVHSWLISPLSVQTSCTLSESASPLPRCRTPSKLRGKLQMSAKCLYTSTASPTGSRRRAGYHLALSSSARSCSVQVKFLHSAHTTQFVLAAWSGWVRRARTAYLTAPWRTIRRCSDLETHPFDLWLWMLCSSTGNLGYRSCTFSHAASFNIRLPLVNIPFRFLVSMLCISRILAFCETSGSPVIMLLREN